MAGTAPDHSDLWVWERAARERGHRTVAGIDEAGRGPLAGPVVAAAVILPPDCDLKGVCDSKQLTAPAREECLDRIRSAALHIGVGIVSHEVIDRINILQATWEAMRGAVRDLGVIPDLCLIDGSPIRDFGHAHQCIVGGDRASISIAAASIVAKVTRDAIMLEYDGTYPEYGFASHKGYPTPWHMDRLREHGACPIHRRSFAPVARTMGTLW